MTIERCERYKRPRSDPRAMPRTPSCDTEPLATVASRIAGRLGLTRPLCCLDLETTGVQPARDRIVEVAVVRIDPGEEPGAFTTATWSTLVNPEVEIPAEASAVHGITAASVATAPTFAEVAPVLAGHLEGADLVGYNLLRFDVPLLRVEFARVGWEIDLFARRILDVYGIFWRRESRDLASAVRFYCDRAHQGHRADADNLATLHVLAAQLERYADLPLGIDELAAFCRAGERIPVTSDGKLAELDGEIVVAFGKYRNHVLRDLAARDPGYLRWMLTGDFASDTKDRIRAALSR